jgi:FkbM family methyltransferase
MKKVILDCLINCLSCLPNFVLNFIKKIFNFFAYIISCSEKRKEFTSEIIIENKKIFLSLKKKDDQAQDVYRPLHKKKIIYELPLLSILIEIFNKKDFSNFLDLGSFIGYYPCVIGKYFENKKLNIFAVESNPEYSKYIQKNINQNNLKNIIIFNEILSDQIEELYVDNEKVYTNNSNLNLIKKSSVTLDKLCKKNNIEPEVIKIDVHGFEGKVLNGFKKNLDKKVKIILLELHSNSFLKKFSNTDKKKIINFLQKNNFNCYIVPFQEQLKLYEVCNNFLLSTFKNLYKKINSENFDSIFFDKLNTDNLIVAMKKDIQIKDYDCFVH